jgi:rubrerythrin
MRAYFRTITTQEVFMQSLTTEEILKKAIGFEELSYSFYKRIQAVVLDSLTKDTLDFLSREELKHKEFLENYLQGKLSGKLLGLAQAHDSKIVEAFPSPLVVPDLPLKDVFLLAAEREKYSHEFYLNLAELHPDGEIKDMFKKLAQEELGHKEKVEYLYVNAAFPQTDGG